MSLWNHPRLTAALCTVAVLGCAAAPAVFLAAADAASLGRVETVADPYVAPTPTADDYYILRQLAARSRNAESEREQRPAEVLTAPKMYIGASASLQSMQYADSAAAEAAENALRQLAETGAVPAAWAAEALVRAASPRRQRPARRWTRPRPAKATPTGTADITTWTRPTASPTASAL